MIERGQGKDRVAVQAVTPEMPERTLPYRIDLWATDGTTVERLLAQAMTLSLARAIYAAATTDYPSRRITLQRGTMVLSDTLANAPSPGGTQQDGTPQK